MTFLTRKLVTAVAAGALTILTTAASAADRVEIEWWHAMSGELGARVDELVKKFNESQDKYTVVAVNKGNYDETINATIAAYRARQQPTIVQIYERGFLTMLFSDAIVPVTDLMEQHGYKIDWSDFIKPVASFYSYKGKLYPMPFNSSTPILWYNVDYFQKAGFDKPAETFQEFDRQLRAIKEKGVSECGLSLPSDYQWSLLENYSAINNQPYGTKANGYEGLDTEFVFNKTSLVQHVERMKAWLDDGIMEIAGQGLSPMQLFTSGKCSTIFSSTASHATVEATAKFNWSATYLPHEEGVEPQNSTIGGAALWVMKGHDEPEYEAAAAFFDYLAKPETQVWWHKATGYVPVTQAAYQMAKAEGYYEEHPTREIAILQLSRGTPNENSMGFRFGNFTQSTLVILEEIEAAFIGQKSVQEALDSAVSRGNAILRQYEKLNGDRS